MKSFEKSNLTSRTNQFSPALVKKIAIGIIGVVIFILLVSWLSSGNKNQQSAQVFAPTPLAKQQINKDFTFSVKDSNGIELTKVKYTLQSAELDNQIIIKGQTATAISGRVFLIVNLAVQNSSDKDIQLDTRNYVRLSVNKSTEFLAPDIHNDPVEVQPISTKLTRIGFPINTTDKNLALRVGEIDGKKETIKLALGK